MGKTSWIYHFLKSHDRVDQFRFDLHRALKDPDLHHPALVSIADQFINQGRMSRKQLFYALDLINKERK
jgi:hypothetical protein